MTAIIYHKNAIIQAHFLNIQNYRLISLAIYCASYYYYSIMNKKIVAGIIVVVIIIILVAINKPKSDTIKIGIVAPLTGGATVYGTNLVKGAELALKDLKGTKNKYELVIEDDTTNPATSASAAQKLISVDKVQAILSVTSGTGNAVKAIAASAKIPQICLCSDSRVADGNSFTNILLAPDETKVWLQEAKARGVKTIAILGQNQSGFNLILDSLRAQVDSEGIKIVYDEKFEATIRDFSTSIAKARAAKADLILAGFFPPQIDVIGQQFKNLGATNVAGIASFSIGADPSLFNNRWYSDASLSDPAFADVFTKAYPDTRFNVRVAPYAYDSLNLLVNGFESGNVTKYLLDTTSYSGKAGTATKKAGESSFHSPIGIWEIRDGKPVQLK